MNDNVNWSKIALFQDLPQDMLDKIKPIFNLVRTKAGEHVITEGEQGDEMFILVKGRVRITKSMIIQGMKLPLAELEDPRKVLATLDHTICPIFGEMAMLDRDQRSATVETLEPSEFLVADRDSFFSVLDREPELGYRLLTVLARRLASTIRKNNSELVKLTTALALALSRQR